MRNQLQPLCPNCGAATEAVVRGTAVQWVCPECGPVEAYTAEEAVYPDYPSRKQRRMKSYKQRGGS